MSKKTKELQALVKEYENLLVRAVYYLQVRCDVPEDLIREINEKKLEE